MTNSEYMSNIQERVWKVEQEILDVIHKICTEHNLKYSLAYGTLLGAVRHRGFIPWDDDIDIMMPREDYEKLLEIWPSVSPEADLLQTYHMYEDYPNNFAKVVKDHTTFLQDEPERKKTFHKGIFVDIFPADRVASSAFGRAIQFGACAVNLLYSRGYTSGSAGVVALVEHLLLSVPQKRYITYTEKTERCIRRWNRCEGSLFFCPCTLKECKKYYPPNLFERLQLMEFNGKFYFAVGDYDTVLRIQYGDYMQLPPEEERVWKHHPLLIDFEHNYEELDLK